MRETSTSSLAKTALFVHASISQAVAVADIASSEKVGAVFTTNRVADARAAIATVRRVAPSAAVMLDANRYSRNSRKLARAGLTAGWIDRQRQLGVTAPLTDSGYLATGDLEGLRRLLDAGHAAGEDTVVVLPLASSWWADDARRRLIEEVGQRGRSVALVLEHDDDPYSAEATVRGVVSFLLEATVPVLNLRSDMSALGVLAFGGTAASIGTRTSLRHLYPVKKGARGGRAASVSLLWANGMAYKTVEKLTDAIAMDPDQLHWRCECTPCAGNSIEWILNSPDVETNAFRHSVAALRLIADELLSPEQSQHDRQLSWIERCRISQANSWEVADLAGRTWKPPSALAAWNRAVPRPVS